MRPAAVKICQPDESEDQHDLRELFLQEAAIISDLKHVPGVVRLEAPSSRHRNTVVVYLRFDIFCYASDLSSAHVLILKSVLAVCCTGPHSVKS